ncbi:tRNA nuclease WapA-like protein [Cladobotryum mycophilum]|uniref:tRNA nuclease WapA-like protein n=1 Tax=Cladobotryum mycophilum TaxID=491253 RepID=A0ABR0S7P7_9HYPO
MNDYLAAVGREVGKVDTDSGGLARYSLKLQIPPGIKDGNEAELSLEYCQGCPNGSLGLGWALSGLSCIRRGPSNLAYDGINTPPADFDRFQQKLTLDGVELLNVKGQYGDQDARYTTEIDNLGRIVSTLGFGYQVLDSMGRRMEYGTTEDSRVVIPSQNLVREWRLKKQIDCHGNSVTYNYVQSPNTGPTSQDVNTCYLSSIRYTSNEKTGHPGSRIVQLEYSPRSDLVVQTVQGDKAIWAHLLTAIRFGVVKGENVRIDRSYEISCSKSQFSGDSYITSVMETANHGSKKVSLLPSTFGYTSPGVPQQDLFKTVPQQITKLRNTTDNIALFTLNVSGRSLADIVCVRYDRRSNSMSIKTYLAERNSNGSIGWNASTGPGAEAKLPTIDLVNGFPSILCPDMNGDGRADLIIPYKDSDGMVRFSISQSVGTGFQSSRAKATSFKWTNESKFMAIDLTGRGAVDVVQIFTEKQNLAFRNFPGITEKGEIKLRDATTTRTKYENTGTIDWFQLNHAGTGARSLVRVWSQNLGGGRSQLMTTNFIVANTADSSAGFKEDKTSLLGSPVRATQIKYSVLPCDINGDGTQDIVLATAEYRNGKMALTYTVYLGDGYGGFQQHGQSILREPSSPPPMGLDVGQFHMTNLNGSNYPSLSYVYQDKNSRAYMCLSVDGKSDGTVGDALLYRIAGDLPSNQMENDEPRVVPIYNHADVTDLLSWAQDPMGLRSSLTYGPVSDPAVYIPAVDWKNFTDDSLDSYPVIAAPNYVVTGIDHRNDASINCLDYQLSIKKTYSSARVNTKGRGWQGFGEIHSLNVTDGVLTTEIYLQSWPLSGLKSQVDTKTPDGKVLRSEKNSYQSVFTQRGSWKIHRSNKILEQTDMLDDGVVARSNVTSYEYDEHGNIILQSSLEIQGGSPMHQSWQRCTYTTINGITGLMTSKKLSSKQDNVNMLTYEEGDGSLTMFEYNPTRATLMAILEWSSDVASFSVKEFEFDDYGNEIRSVDAAGLETLTTYDDLFKNCPVKVTQKGPGVLSTEYTAFDEASGMEVAKLEENGLLACYRLDGFGRAFETRLKSKDQNANGSAVAANEFFSDRSFVVDQTFAKILAGSFLDPYRSLSFERLAGTSGSYISSRVQSFSKEGVDGLNEMMEVVDCANRVRKRSSRHADETEKIWKYWEYDSRGQQIFDGFPCKAPASSGPDWTPDLSLGVRSTYDTLGRPVTQIRPPHGGQDHFVVSSTTYLDGGSRIKEQTLRTNDAKSLVDATVLSSIQRTYVRIGTEDHVVQKVDENGLCATFEYDVFGSLITCTNPTGQKEQRSYNAKGNIISLNNPYQNTLLAKDTKAVEFQYDAANHLVRHVNAVGEIITYQRDAKGRSLRKMGSDGRMLVYEYDRGGTENLSSVTIYPNGPDAPFESKFEFTYDHRGRIWQRTLTLSDGTSYTTSIEYDWLGYVVKKVHPDGAIVANTYRGALMRSSTLSGGSSTWSLKANISQYNNSEHPERLVLQGTGMQEQFVHEWKYDSEGFPTSHSLGTDTRALVQDHYAFNDLSQISRKHEFVSGTTIDYTYEGKRLDSSQSGNGPRNYYSYDATGNLLQNRETSIAYTPGRAVGTRHGEAVFDVTYDVAGRMKQRTTNDSTTEFAYDSFGTLNIHIQADGSRIVRHKLFHNDHVLGTVSNTYESVDSERPLGNGQRKMNVQFADTKGTVTHIFNAEDANLLEKLEYDDYGLLQSEPSNDVSHVDTTSTYEGKYLDDMTGLLDFSSRWYDPLVGRFTTPDDLLDAGLLMETDGFNRYAFENNDPINHVDPTGHWSFSSICGVVLGACAIVGAIALTVVTGGAAAPLAAAAVGALISGGIAGITYSVDHRDEEDAGKFWGGFATTVAINAAIGAATGALGAAATPARIMSGTGRLAAKIGWDVADKTLKTIGVLGTVGGRALIGGGASVFTKATERGVENAFYGAHNDLFAGWVSNFGKGAAVGAVFGAIGARKLPKDNLGSFKLRSFTGLRAILAPKPTNPWAIPGITTQVLKASLKPPGKLAGWAYQRTGLNKKVENFRRDFKRVNGFG